MVAHQKVASGSALDGRVELKVISDGGLLLLIVGVVLRHGAELVVKAKQKESEVIFLMVGVSCLMTFNFQTLRKLLDYMTFNE